MKSSAGHIFSEHWSIRSRRLLFVLSILPNSTYSFHTPKFPKAEITTEWGLQIKSVFLCRERGRETDSKKRKKNEHMSCRNVVGILILQMCLSACECVWVGACICVLCDKIGITLLLFHFSSATTPLLLLLWLFMRKLNSQILAFSTIFN